MPSDTIKLMIKTFKTLGIIIVWIIVTITIGYFKFNTTQFIYASLVMLFLTYYTHHELNTTMSLKNAILLTIIPNAIMWYLAYHCNNFLWIYPLERWVFVSIFLVYSYILMYIVCEF